MSDKYIIVGTLDGALASAITQSTDGGLTLKSGKNSAPIIMPGTQVEKLTAEERQAVKSTYEAGHPVVLLDVTSEEINALHGILETGLSHSFAPGITRAEAYGFNKEPGGVHAQGTFYDPEVEFKATFTMNHRNEDGTTVESTIDEGFKSVLDGEESQQGRWLGLQNWIADAGKRFERAPEAGPEGGVTDQLTSLARAFIDTVQWTSSVRLPVFGITPTWRVYTNTYQLTNFCYSCYSRDNRSNWFYVQQQWVLNAGSSYILNTTLGQGYYVDNYTMTAWPRNYGNQIQRVTMLQSSPPSTTGASQVTSAVGYAISGTIGFEGMRGVGSVTGGINVSSSRTMEIPDVTVHNISNLNGNDAGWIYTMPRSQGVEDGCRNSIYQCKVVSRSTFQPFNQWIWRVVPRDTGGLAVGVRFSLQLVMSTIGACNIFGCNCDVNHLTERPVLNDHFFNIPNPPVV